MDVPRIFFAVETPDNLKAMKLDMFGGGVWPGDAELISEHEDVRHRFHLAFTVDGAVRKLDVAFRLKVLKKSAWRVPGMP